MRIKEKKISENYLQCCAELDLACFKLCLITLEELAEVVWQWNKALDPGVFESPNSEIQTQISNENFQFFLSNVREAKLARKGPQF